MTPTSNKPLNKVTAGAIAAAVAAIVLALVKNYLWIDMPADLEGPVNTLVAALVIGGLSGFAGYMTPIAPGEITQTDQRITEARPQ
jgi:hypothetical protein